MAVKIGTAGWSIGRAAGPSFPVEGSALERYSAVFDVAEINSSFQRPHRPSTWERWRDSVPDEFRFAVKVPQEITHRRKLVDCAGTVSEFLEQVAGLGDKLAVLLVQLPPKLGFDAAVAEAFFSALAGPTGAAIVCEPRNPGWFEDEAEALMQRLQVARVAADPAMSPAAAKPGGWSGLGYWRLHGSPDMYRSSYADRIDQYAQALAGAAEQGGDQWCIFDNTASSAAIGDALLLARRLGGKT